MESEVGVRDLLDALLISCSDVQGVENPRDVCSDLCRYLSLYPKHAAIIGDILATLGREEQFREIAGESKILSALVCFLSSPDESTRLQITRAIGNLCIDNDSNREIISRAGGCRILTEAIKTYCDSSNERYKCALCGCVLNLASDNEELAQEFILQDVHEIIPLMLNIPNQSESVITMGLQALCILTETVNQVSVDCSLVLKTVVHILSRCREGDCDYLKHALELVKIFIDKEDENFALQLIDAGIVGELLHITQSEMKQRAIDLIVLLLGKDKCMKILFDDGEILMVTREWLESTSQTKMANASLMIANIARSDSNCFDIIQRGFVPLLMKTVQIEETEAMMGKLHHAALSALRNLSLPTEYKEKLFSMGVIDCAGYALKNSTMSHVHFKALGIIRLLVDAQEPICLYVVKETLESICDVCKDTSISHIHIETGRLLSTIVKHCQDQSVLLRILRQGGLKWIYLLLQQEQVQLIGEGLMALNIIAVLNNEEVLLLFHDETNLSIVNHLCAILTSSYPLNVVNNSLVLVKTLLSKESDMKHLLENSLKLKEAVQILLLHDNKEIQIKASGVSESLKI